MAMMLGVIILLKKFSIPIPAFRTRISFAWLPLMIIGWFFGPITGLVFGAIADTVGYLMGGGVWFWLYAIQEPIVGFFSGVIGSIAFFAKKNLTKHIWLHLFVHFSFYIIFYSITIGYIVYFYIFKPVSYNKETTSLLSDWAIFLSIGLMTLYTFISFATTIYIACKKKSNLIVYLYASIIIYSMISLWAFILGPYTSVLYYKFLNGGREPGPYINYGAIYYLIPRILREMIKSPIQAIILTVLIVNLTPIFNNIAYAVQNSLHYLPVNKKTTFISKIKKVLKLK